MVNVLQEARNGVSRCIGSDDPEARRKAAMHDPEVQAILNDPAMQMILQQMQSQPEALREYVGNNRRANETSETYCPDLWVLSIHYAYKNVQNKKKLKK